MRAEAVDLPGDFAQLHETRFDADTNVYEHGWQSFSPTTTYRGGEPPHRPVTDRNRILNYREASHPGREGYFGEGILAVDDGTAVHVVAADDPFTTGVRIRAERTGTSLTISSDGPASTHTFERVDSEDPIQSALESWARSIAAAHGLTPPRRAPTGWCSWYHYFGSVGEDDIIENLRAIDDFELETDVVQLDDGYEAEIGDWLIQDPRFPDLRGLVGRIRDHGRRAGLWLAPFCVGARSRLADEHPEWMLRHPHGGPMHAGYNWEQDLFSLDLTHPGAASHVQGVFSTLCDWGFDYFKLDFLASGAVSGQRHSGADPVTAYRTGLEVIRDAVGSDVHLLLCGAPILQSVGFADSVRVSPDTDTSLLPADGDTCSPGQRNAIRSARGRQFMNGVFFINDPDCLIVRPDVEDREGWADQVRSVGGAVVSSDRLRELDSWGLETTRATLATARGSSLPAR